MNAEASCLKCGEIISGQHVCDPLDIAAFWLFQYLSAQDEIELTCAIESLAFEPDPEWVSRLEFIAACFAAGVSPAPYADEIIAHQKTFNELSGYCDDN